MRKIILHLFAPVIVASWANAQITSGDWTYTLNTSNEATITGYSGAGGVVTIPAIIDGHPVNTVGETADYMWAPIFGWYNATVTSVIIPYGVTSIGRWAFSRCTSLTTVTIPDSVTTIGRESFSECPSLTNVNIPNSVTSIEDSAFSGCTSLTGVTIPNDVTTIGNYAFSRCTSLTSVAVGDNVTIIGNWAFQDCTGITAVSIGNSVTSIGDGTFAGCNSLTSVTIPESVTSIGSMAFVSCDSLTSVTIPDSVTTIANDAFAGCSSLTSVTIPNSVISIGERAFSGCTSLTSVVIPSRFAVKIGTFGLQDELAMNLMVQAISERILSALPQNYGIATKNDLTTVVSNTIAQVQSSPNSYSLYSEQQYSHSYDSGVTAGTALVTQNPASYNLYTSDSIMDLRMNGAMVPKSNGVASVSIQPTTTTNLMQPFTNNGGPITFELPMPANRAFMRIQTITP